MTDIDIDAIRQQVPFIWAHWSAIQDTPQPGLVTDRLICAQQSADDIPTVLRWVEKLTKKVAELTAERDAACALSVELLRDKRHLDDLTAALTQSRAQAATYANEIGTLTAENARLRQQRDGQTAVVEAAKAWRAEREAVRVGSGTVLALSGLLTALAAAVVALPKAEATR